MLKFFIFKSLKMKRWDYSELIQIKELVVLMKYPLILVALGVGKTKNHL